MSGIHACALGDVDLNGDIAETNSPHFAGNVEEAAVGPRTFLLEPSTRLNASAMAIDVVEEAELATPHRTSFASTAAPISGTVPRSAPRPSEQPSTSRLQAIVRRARELHGHHRQLWDKRERDAFDLLVERDQSC